MNTLALKKIYWYKTILFEVFEVRIHVVRPGETLWTIVRHYNVPLRELISENLIADIDLIYPGTTLRIPKPSIEVNGYLTPKGPTGEAILRGTGEDLTYVEYIQLSSPR